MKCFGSPVEGPGRTNDTLLNKYCVICGHRHPAYRKLLNKHHDVRLYCSGWPQLYRWKRFVGREDKIVNRLDHRLWLFLKNHSKANMSFGKMTMNYSCRREDWGQGGHLSDQSWCMANPWVSSQGCLLAQTSRPVPDLLPSGQILDICLLAAVWLPPPTLTCVYSFGQDQWIIASKLLLSLLVPEAQEQLSRWFPGVFVVRNNEGKIKMPTGSS